MFLLYLLVPGHVRLSKPVSLALQRNLNAYKFIIGLPGIHISCFKGRTLPLLLYTITQVDPLAIIIPEMADNRQTNQPKTNYNK